MSTLVARTVQLHRTEAQWLLNNFVPHKGEIVIYDPDENIPSPRLKTGDGIHLLSELPFITADSGLSDLIIWREGIAYFDCGEVR